MPTLTIYTDANRIGTCDVPPFVNGDATNAWTLKFHNGSAYYAPASVSMKVGNINGLTAGQAAAFKWNDRAGNSAIYTIAMASNIPSLTEDSHSGTAPVLVGGSGIYLIRGQVLGGGQAVTSLVVANKGQGYVTAPVLSFSGGDGSGAAGTVTLDALTGSVLSVSLLNSGFFAQFSTVAVTFSGGGGTGAAAVAVVSPGNQFVQSVVVTNPGTGYTSAPTVTLTPSGSVTTTPTAYASLGPLSASIASVSLSSPGSGYTTAPLVSLSGGNGSGGQILATLAPVTNPVPYKSLEATQAVIGAVELVPYSDGNRRLDGSIQYDHSFVVVKPRTVATASLSQSGTDWIGSLDPINAWVTALLGLRRSVALDLQIIGDGRMLFEGTLVILNKIT